MVHETITLEGHLIDSDIMRRVFDRVVEDGGEFEVLEFRVGRRNDEPSFARIAVRAESPQVLGAILEGVRYLGAATDTGDALFAPAEADGILPDEFYSTTNFETWLRVGGRWLAAADQKMDCALVLRDGLPRCVKMGQVRKDERVALRGPGIRVRPPERSRDYSVFGFMTNEVSAEVNKTIAVAGTAREMRRARADGERIVVVAGPAVVHSGGDVHLSTPVEQVNLSERTIKIGGDTISWRALVATIPLPELVARVVDAPKEIEEAAGKLRCTPVRYLNVATKSSPKADFHWIYVPEEKFPFYRVGIYTNAVPAMAPPGRGSLYVELSDRGPMPRVDDIMPDVAQALAAAGAINSADDVLFAEIKELKYAYVVFDDNYYSCVAKLISYFESKNVFPRGRYGSWIYNAMEDSILAGRDIAEKLSA